MKAPIGCSVCGAELKVTTCGRYESLDEHVSDPNGTPTLKDGYTCSMQTCLANMYGAVWTADGEVYMNPPDHLGHSEAYDKLKYFSADDLVEARNSWCRSYEEMLLKQKRNTLNVKLYFLWIEIEPTYVNVSKDEYVWKVKNYKWRWMTRRAKGFYESFSPIWDILRYKNWEFKMKYRSAISGGSKSDLQDLMSIYDDTMTWSSNRKENRFWYRVANWLLRTWYQREFMLLNTLEGRD